MSCFRNCAGNQIDRYFRQIDSLEKKLRDQDNPSLKGLRINLLLGYGDSTDTTPADLYEHCEHRYGAWLIDVTHGGKEYGSVENIVRFSQLSFIGNKLLIMARSMRSGGILGIVESDLIWDPLEVINILELYIKYHELFEEKLCIAPMIMEKGPLFYDTFAFRSHGTRFRKAYPYHYLLPSIPSQAELMDMDSVGSMVFGGWDIMTQGRFPEGKTNTSEKDLLDQGAIVGYCKSLRDMGCTITLAPKITIYHP
jgi:hypothetical protein